MNTDSTPPLAARPWFKRIGLLLVVVCVFLGVFVSVWFTFAALGLWIGMIVAGGGACPLGTCAVPRERKD